MTAHQILVFQADQEAEVHLVAPGQVVVVAVLLLQDKEITVVLEYIAVEIMDLAVAVAQVQAE
jgi:hypothetical protein